MWPAWYYLTRIVPLASARMSLKEFTARAKVARGGPFDRNVEKPFCFFPKQLAERGAVVIETNSGRGNRKQRRPQRNLVVRAVSPETSSQLSFLSRPGQRPAGGRAQPPARERWSGGRPPRQRGASGSGSAAGPPGGAPAWPPRSPSSTVLGPRGEGGPLRPASPFGRPFRRPLRRPSRRPFGASLALLGRRGPFRRRPAAGKDPTFFSGSREPRLPAGEQKAEARLG